MVKVRVYVYYISTKLSALYYLLIMCYYHITDSR